MLERSELILKTVCLALAALLLVQAIRLLAWRDPLVDLQVPDLPTLTTNAPPATGKTNATPQAKHLPAAKAGAATQPHSTTNATHTTPRPAPGRTHLPPQVLRQMALHGRPPFGRPGMSHRGSPLPKMIEARVDRIAQSEILGPIMHPLPMALLGIAGPVVFLRAPNGQTGLVKEGEELGGIKLLRIGTNRVLIEEGGQKKELTLFSGYGGESLLNQSKAHSP